MTQIFINNIHYIQTQLKNWYADNHRQLPWRDTDNPYHIWVSEVMLQQTQVKTVIPYYHRFLQRFPDVKHLAQADVQDVLKIWEGLGYYARARNLHSAAKAVVEKYNGKIPEDWKAFRKLPGVGEYIASAVQSIAFHYPYAVADGNVKRVLARLFQLDAPVNQPASHKIFKNAVDKLIPSDNSGMFNQAVMELGALVCKLKSPQCEICPVQSVCLAYKHQAAAQYPKRVETKPVPTYHLVTGVVFLHKTCVPDFKIGKTPQVSLVSSLKKVLITRRKPDGLLGGLWEFPGGDIQKNEEAIHACVRQVREKVNLCVEADVYIARVKHAYTHFKIVMDVFQCRYVSGRVKLKDYTDYCWITLDEIDHYPFPKANHKFIPMIREKI